MITPPPQSYSTTTTHNPLGRFFKTTFSYDSNLMLAAIIFLLLVILFVLLLHIYSRWFLLRFRQSSVTLPHVLGSHPRHFTTINDTTSDHSSPSNGLHPSLISSLPLFVFHKTKDEISKAQTVLECAICISLFEDEEKCRKLPKCGHSFHPECIDMWLHFHSTCPICRAGVVCETKMNNVDTTTLEEASNAAGLHLEIDVAEDLNTENVNEDDLSITNDRVPEISSSEPSYSGMLKRILSNNRSERKVHPSAGITSELEV